MNIVTKTSIREYPLLSRGKVRDIYEIDPQTLLIVTTDRMSAFDVIMNEPIPYKGVVLNQITLYWMDACKDLVRNHLLATDVRDFPAALESCRREAAASFGDERVLRLVRKWLRAGVLDEGVWSVSETGTPQGAVISPLLANVFLHYVFDLWAQQWRRREATGTIIFVRYADDVVAGFEHEADARRFWQAMRERFARFGLELHEDKTRLLEFGRHAVERRRQQGLGKPQTFTFLGFTFIIGKSRRGAFLLKRKTRSDRMRVRLREIKEQLRRRMHDPIPEQGQWLKAVVAGYDAGYMIKDAV